MVVFYNMSENEVKSYPDFHLSIEIYLNRVSLLLVNKQNSKPEAIEHLARDNQDFGELIEQSSIVSLASPSTISATLINSVFSLVPKALFQEENTELYLAQVADISQNHLVKSDTFITQNIITCFVIDSGIHAQLISKFPTVQLKHISSVLCDSISDGVAINFSSPNSYEIAIKQEKKLTYFNRFEFENKDESLYYLGLAMEKHGLDMAQTKFQLSGEIFKDGETLSFWNQFIPQENITFNAIAASQLNAIARHQFFTLHKQHSCVL